MILALYRDLPSSLRKVDPRVMTLALAELVLLLVNLMLRKDFRIFPNEIYSWSYLVVRVPRPEVDFIMGVVLEAEVELPSAT
jgi:hypothetical protein